MQHYSKDLISQNVVDIQQQYKTNNIMSFRMVLNSALCAAVSASPFFRRFPSTKEIVKSSSNNIARWLSLCIPTTACPLQDHHDVSDNHERKLSSSTPETTQLNLKFHWEKIIPSADPNHGTPCERSSHGLSLLNKGKLLILHGGEHIARTPLDDSQSTWAAEQTEGDDVWSWRSIASATTLQPPPRVGHAQCVYHDTTVYIFGGRAGIDMGEAAMNDLWKLDCTSWTWSQVTPTGGSDPPPSPRSFHKMMCIGSSLYVFGGCDATGRLADLHRFDISTNTWKTLPSSSLRGRGGANFVPLASEQCLGVVAGFCGEECNDGQLLDVATKTWKDGLSEQLSGLRPRSVCVSASFPSLGVAVIFGGEVDPSERGHEGAGGFENDLVLLDETTGIYLTTTSTDRGSSWPEARGWSDGASCADAATGNGKLYVYGGLSGDDSSPKRLGDLWCLNIEKQ